MIRGIISSGSDERASRVYRLLTSIVHFAGGVAGGAAAGGAAWFVATPVRTLFPGTIALAALVGVAVYAVLSDFHVSDRRIRMGRQVPATWRATYGHYPAYAAYGAWLGAGFVTVVPFAVVYVVFGAAGLLLPLGGAIVTGAAFGGARAGAVVLGALWAEGSCSALLRFAAYRRTLPTIGLIVSISIVAVAVTSALG